VLATAQAEADQIRKEAGDEARKAIAEAQQAARQRTDAAKEQARAIVEEAEQRRGVIEGQIHELAAQRKRAIDEIGRLRDALTNALAQQRIGEQRPETAVASSRPRPDGAAAAVSRAPAAPRQPARG
jgi:chromosome segregation ATPase